MGWSDVMHLFLSPMSLKGTKQQISFPFTPTGKIPIVLVSLLACWHVCSNSHFPLTDLGGYQWAGTRLSHRKRFRPSGWKPFDVLLVYCILIKANHYKWECNGFCTMHDRWWNILPISGLVTTTTYRFIHTHTHRHTHFQCKVRSTHETFLQHQQQKWKEIKIMLINALWFLLFCS